MNDFDESFGEAERGPETNGLEFGGDPIAPSHMYVVTRRPASNHQPARRPKKPKPEVSKPRPT